jgi:hypothetical protein
MARRKSKKPTWKYAGVEKAAPGHYIAYVTDGWDTKEFADGKSPGAAYRLCMKKLGKRKSTRKSNPSKKTTWKYAGVEKAAPGHYIAYVSDGWDTKEFADGKSPGAAYRLCMKKLGKRKSTRKSAR